MKFSVSVVDNHDADWSGNGDRIEFDSYKNAVRAARNYREHFPDRERYSVTVSHSQLGPVGIF